MAITCRYISSHTRRLAQEVFKGDLLTAWAVIPDYMNQNNIIDESQINADSLLEFYNNQKEEIKTKYALEYPEVKIKRVPAGTEIDFLLKDDNGNLYLEVPENMSETEYCLKYRIENEDEHMYNSISDVALFEAYYYKAKSILELDDAFNISIEWYNKGMELFDIENKIDFNYIDTNEGTYNGPSIVLDRDNNLFIEELYDDTLKNVVNKVLIGTTEQEKNTMKNVYKILHDKYNLNFSDLVSYVAQDLITLEAFMYFKGKVMQKFNIEDAENANNPEYAVINEIRNILYAMYKLTGHDYTQNSYQDNGGLIKSESMTFNKEQSNAIRGVANFISDRLKGNKVNSQFIRIIGAAGTGKTTIINEIIKRVRTDTGIPLIIGISALSHKATANLYNKISVENIINNKVIYKTLAGLLKKGGDLKLDENKQSYVEFSPTYDVNNLEDMQVKIPLRDMNLVFIDEVSMLTEEDHALINNLLNPNTTVVYIGDNAQLPPIRSKEASIKHKDQDSPAFYEQMPEYKLEERVRQGEGNPILDLADQYRNVALGKTNILPNLYNLKNNKNISSAANLDDNTLYRIFSTRRALGVNDYARIITYTNKSVIEYNTRVHNLLYPEDALQVSYVPHEGEPLMFYDSYETKSRDFLNSEECYIKKISSIQYDPFNDVYYYEVDVNCSDNKSYTIQMLADYQDNYDNLEYAVSSKLKEAEEHVQIAKNLSGGAAYSEYEKAKKLRKEASLIRGKYAKCKLAYAITSHKSQGSTYNISIVDASNIVGMLLADRLTKKSFGQCMYTAVTRASDLVIMKVGNSNNTTVQIAELPVPKKPNTQNSSSIVVPKGFAGNIANIKIIEAPLNNTKNANLFKGFSGNAEGSDQYWRQEVLKKGVTNWIDYTVNSYTNLSESEKSIIEDAYIKASASLGKKYYPHTGSNADYLSDLQRRNYMQIQDADAVFAVSRIIKPGGTYNKGVLNSTNLEHIDGGTGYAVEYGIAKGIPIHIFNTLDNKWYEWDYTNNKYVETETPILTYKFAAVGNRELTPEGKQAITNVVEKTFTGNEQIAPVVSTPIKDTTKQVGVGSPAGVTNTGGTEGTKGVVGTSGFNNDDIDKLYKAHLASGQMNDYYNGEKRPEVTADNTLDAITRGERHATTRYQNNNDYWMKRTPGEIVKFWDKNNGRSILVKITKPSVILPSTTNAEEWSKLEGWTVEKYNRDVLPHVLKAEACQIYFDYIPNSYRNPNVPQGQQVDINSININGRIVNPNNVLNSIYFKREKLYTRESVSRNKNNLYIFTDNTNRFSGNNPIDPNSKYAKKYGADKTYPNYTQAQIRGLDNAMPISTQKYFVPKEQGGDYKKNRWEDGDVEEFAKVLRDEISSIITEFKNGDYNNIVISEGDGFFNSGISDINPNNRKNIYNKLLQGLDYLNNEIKKIGEEKAKARLEATKTVLGGGSHAADTIQSAITAGQQGISEEQYLKEIEPFFSMEESAKIRSAIPNVVDKWGRNNGMLQVTSLSRHTDPVFFTKEIIDFLKLNALKPMDDPTRVNVVEIWTKHDGLPLQDLLDACKQYRVAPMVSFSITSLGGTAFEEGVLKYQDLLDKIKKLVQNGDLNVASTTIRLDPILYGYTDMSKIFDIAKQCIDMGFKKFVTSALQSYDFMKNSEKGSRMVVEGITESLKKEGKTYDWNEYYGINSKGVINHTLKPVYLQKLGDEFINFFKDYPDVTIQSCSSRIGNLKSAACLDPLVIERLTNCSVTRPDGTVDKDTSRRDCMCYGAHSDFFPGSGDRAKKCYSSCAYCYAGRSQDNAINYYNPDGTINKYGFIEIEGNTITVEDLTTVRDPDNGINIGATSTSVLGKALTNPYNNLKVEYKGTTFNNAEHAYQTWKSGQFDQVAYDNGNNPDPSISFKPKGALPVDKNSNFNTMVEILTEKFKQHTTLLDSVTIKGGINFLKNCTHFVIGDTFWETGTGCMNKFIEALTNAYSNAIDFFINNPINKIGVPSIETIEEGMDKPDPITIAIDRINNDDIEIDTSSPIYNVIMELGPVKYTNRLKMIAHDVSNGINSKLSQLERTIKTKINKGTATFHDKEILALLMDKDDDESGARQRLIGEVINNVIKDIKQQYLDDYEFMKNSSKEEIEEEYECPDGDYYREQYRIIAENFDYLFDGACQQIEDREGIRLFREDNSVNIDTTDSIKKDQEKQDGDNSESNRSLGNDGWGSAEKDPITVARGIIKRALSNIADYNYDGSIKVDDLGDTIDCDPNMCIAILLDELSKNVHSVEDFNTKIEIGKDDNGDPNYQWEFPALKKIGDKYPWAKIFYNNIKTKQNIRLASAIYSNLCLKFHKYYTQANVDKEEEETYKDDDGKEQTRTIIKTVRETIPLNQKLSEEAIMKRLSINYMSHTPLNNNSIWNSAGDYVLGNARELTNSLNTIAKNISAGGKISDDIKELSDILNSIGIESKEEELNNLFKNNDEDSVNKCQEILNNATVITRGVSSLNKGDHIINSYKNAYSKIANIIGTVTNTTASPMFRQGGKMYSSYSFPNYLDILTEGIKSENYKNYIENEFLYDDFIAVKNKEGNYNIKSNIIDLLYNDKEIRDNFDIKYTTELEGIKYDNWDHDIIVKSNFTEYASVPIGNTNHQYGYYQCPIFSDSTMTAYVKMPKYIRNFKNEINSRLADVALQEVSRITKVLNRREANASPIQRFDNKGDKFLFIPELNNVIIEGKSLYQYIMDMGNNIDRIHSVLQEAIASIMEKDCNNYLINNGPIISENDPATDKESYEKDLREMEQFYYNNALAQTQIIMLTTTDLAYYKDYTDFQKRFKQTFASGSRLNTNSKYGRKTQRSIYLSDKIITSMSYDGIVTSIKDAVAKRYLTKNEALEVLKKARNINATDAQAYRTLSSYRAVLDMRGKWSDRMQSAFERFVRGTWEDEDFNIMWGAIKPFLFANVKTHDGLGGFMRTPVQQKSSEFLLLGFLQGMYIKNKIKDSPVLLGLNRAMEDFTIDTAIFESGVKAGGQGIINITYSEKKLNELNAEDWEELNYDSLAYIVHENNPDIEDFNIVDNISKQLMELYKNNDIQDILNNSNMSKKDKKILKSFSKLSKWDTYKSAYDYQLLSYNITQDDYNTIMKYMQPSEEEVYETIKNALFEPSRFNDTFEYDEITGRNINKNVIHEIDYNYVMEAQPTVNHLVDGESVVGSQFRNIIVSDLPINFTIEINGKKYTNYGKDNNEIVQLYDSIMNENILSDWNKINKIFGSIDKLQKKLIGIVKGNNNYGQDLLNALQLVQKPDGTKTFNIPAHNSVISAKLEQLVLSVFKNDITKQYIRGGACVLVSSFGFSEDLQIIRGSNGAITHFECMLPAHTKEMFKDYLKKVYDKEGNFVGNEIDIEKIRQDGLEGLLEGVGFRIPTEGKYSMANLMVKGFLPQQCGATVMLPADTTMLSGEDYDVDKKFIFFKECKRIPLYNMKQARKDFLEAHPELSKEIDENYTNLFHEYIQRVDSDISEEDIADMSKQELKEYRKDFNKWLHENNVHNFDFSETADEQFTKWFGEQIKKKQINGKPMYYVDSKLIVPQYDQSKDPFHNSRIARDNMIIDIANAILSSPEISYIINKSGNYDTISLESDRVQIFRNPKWFELWCEKYKAEYIKDKDPIDALLEAPELYIFDFIEEYKIPINPLDAETFAYFHEQNMVGKKLVGIYANGTTIQSKYQHSNVGIHPNYTFTINGYKVDSISNDRRVDDKGSRLISTNASEFSAASVDNTKDPKLANMKQSPDNAFITDVMIKSGLTIQEISLFFSLPFFDTNVDTIIDEKLHPEAYKAFLSNEHFSITSKELVKLILNGKQEKDDDLTIKARAILAKIITIGNRNSLLTQISRADSPNGAISNTLAGAIQQVMKVNDFHRYESTDPVFTNTSNIVKNITPEMASHTRDNYREHFKYSDMPMLQAFYTLGIEDPLNTIMPLFKHVTPGALKNLDFINRELNSDYTLDTKIIQAYLRESVIYSLTNSTLFNNIDAQRQYYTNIYPQEFANIVSLPKFRKYSIIRNIIAVQGNTMQGALNSKESYTLILPKSNNVKTVAETYKRELNMMLIDSDPDIRTMAIDLFKYSYFIDGLDWRVDGFSMMFDTLFMTSIKSYIETLRNMTFDSSSNFSDFKFLEQFIYNHGAQIFKKVDFEQYANTPAIIIIDKNKDSGIFKSFINHKTNNYYKYISVHGNLYEVDSTNSSDNSIVYNKIVNNNSKYLIYNINVEDTNTLNSNYINMQNNSISNPTTSKLSNDIDALKAEFTITSNPPSSTVQSSTVQSTPTSAPIGGIDTNLGFNIEDIPDISDFSYEDIEEDFKNMPGNSAGPSFDYQNDDQKIETSRLNSGTATSPRISTINIASITRAMIAAGANDEVINNTIASLQKQAEQDYNNMNENNCPI